MTPHQVHIGPDDLCFVIYFDIAYLRPELAGSNAATIDTELLARAPELAPFVYQQQMVFELSDEQVALLESLCQRMLREQHAPRLCSREITRASLELLLAEVTQDRQGDILPLMRERPPMGGGEKHVRRVMEFIDTVFISLEDETGVVQVICWKSLRDLQRRELLASRLLAVYGTWQREGDTKNLIARRLEDLTPLLGRLATESRDFH